MVLEPSNLREKFPIRAVFGLGNPGEEYRNTRHNLGCMLADRLAGKAGFREKKGVLISECPWLCGKLIIGKPPAFMNMNGKAVLKLIEKYSLQPFELLIAYDDIDLALGKIRIREKGGSGGHKGVISVIQELQTDGFPRLRMGIRSEVYQGLSLTEFVLSRFEREELPIVDTMLDTSVEAIQAIGRDGFAKAMSRFNRDCKDPC